MTREEAENTPLLIDKKLTLQKVLEVEAHGLSLSDSAYLLRVTPQRLGRFVKSHGIEWRGKKAFTKAGEVNPESYRQQIKNQGVTLSAVNSQMYRNNLKFDDAVAKVVVLQKQRQYLTKSQSDFIVENYKKMGCKAVAEYLGLPKDRVKCRYNYVIYVQCKKEALSK